MGIIIAGIRIPVPVQVIHIDFEPAIRASSIGQIARAVISTAVGSLRTKDVPGFLRIERIGLDLQPGIVMLCGRCPVTNLTTPLKTVYSCGGDLYRVTYDPIARVREILWTFPNDEVTSGSQLRISDVWRSSTR